MPIKTYKPTTPGRKNDASVLDTSHLADKDPEPSLTTVIRKSGGRNNQGKITVRHRGGKQKRVYRQVDFDRMNFGVEGEVQALEYDPNRSAHIALIDYPEDEPGPNKAYILAAEGLRTGDTVKSSKNEISADVGNRMPLRHIPIGLFVYNLEFTPGKGGQIVRSAGAGAQIQAKEDDFVQIRLPSSEIRMFSEDAFATIGKVGNPEHELVKLGKAGRKRHRGVRPTVKGKAMNPVDHPHGGGSGWTPVGQDSPKTPQAKKAMGKKTRDQNKESDKFIVKRKNE